MACWTAGPWSSVLGELFSSAASNNVSKYENQVSRVDGGKILLI